MENQASLETLQTSKGQGNGTNSSAGISSAIRSNGPNPQNHKLTHGEEGNLKYNYYNY